MDWLSGYDENRHNSNINKVHFFLLFSQFYAHKTTQNQTKINILEQIAAGGIFHNFQEDERK